MAIRTGSKLVNVGSNPVSPARIKRRRMKIYINDENGKRKIVEAAIIKKKATNIVVRLLDGRIIKRKKNRDIPNGE